MGHKNVVVVFFLSLHIRLDYQLLFGGIKRTAEIKPICMGTDHSIDVCVVLCSLMLSLSIKKNIKLF